MATKKKTVDYLGGYIPASYTPEVSSNQILLIPPYDDQGISFKGYSKRLKSVGQYELFPQIRRTQNFYITAGMTFSTGPRSDTNKIFYAASVHVDYLNSSGIPIDILVIDGSLATDRQRILCTINNGSGHFNIDFTNSPRDFQQINMSLWLSSALALGDYMNITMIGWSE